MKKLELQTPAILVDTDIMERNIRKYHGEAAAHGRELWPMLKTHKSTEILRMQLDAGATGVLCGTLDEADAAAAMGVHRIMYAYPVASRENIARVIELAKKHDMIIRLDDLTAASLVNEEAIKADVVLSYTIIVDLGLHRFGVLPDDVVSFAGTMSRYRGLKLRGLSAHPGHVYSAQNPSEVAGYVREEHDILTQVSDALKRAGYTFDIVSSGTTPTFAGAMESETINIYHPGNYVFHDAIQMSLGTAAEADCALTVLATVISNPRNGEWMIDAGSKCLGLDLGAHGNDSIKGHGFVKGHPNVTVAALSEEVGRLVCKEDEHALAVGDKVEIIPNHSCSTANLTDYLIAVRGDDVEGTIEVDIRGNKTKKIDRWRVK